MTANFEQTAAIGSKGMGVIRIWQGAFWSDVTVNTKHTGTRRGACACYMKFAHFE
jgi:hypothetical protein